MNKYARVYWTAGDIIDAAESYYEVSISEKEAEEFLRMNAKYIESTMVSAGFDYIEDQLDEYLPTLSKDPTVNKAWKGLINGKTQ